MPPSDFEDESSLDELFPIELSPVEDNSIPLPASSYSIVNNTLCIPPLPPAVPESLSIADQTKLFDLVKALVKHTITQGETIELLGKSNSNLLKTPENTPVKKKQIEMLSAELTATRQKVSELSLENLILKQQLKQQKQTTSVLCSKISLLTQKNVSSQPIQDDQQQTKHPPKRQRR